MKLPARKILILGSIFAGLIIVLLFCDSQKVGRELDRYHGVPVYYNGLLFFRGYGKNYSADGYYYGQKWQCVEFVKRFFDQVKGHRMPDAMGHAKSFFDEKIQNGAMNPRRGLIQYWNGSTNPPQADDLLVFTDTQYGHVAIVTEVGENYLEVIQQNILSKPRQRYSIITTNGHYFISRPRRPEGWLRKN
jgi:surface antigen